MAQVCTVWPLFHGRLIHCHYLQRNLPHEPMAGFLDQWRKVSSQEELSSLASWVTGLSDLGFKGYVASMPPPGTTQALLERYTLPWAGDESATTFGKRSEQPTQPLP